MDQKNPQHAPPPKAASGSPSSAPPVKHYHASVELSGDALSGKTEADIKAAIQAAFDAAKPKPPETVTVEDIEITLAT